MSRKKQQIRVEILNPEAMEQASINKSKALVDLFWNKIKENPKQFELVVKSLNSKDAC